MSARRDRRQPGGRTASTTEPGSHPEPGPDRPVRSNGPERPLLPDDASTRSRTASCGQA